VNVIYYLLINKTYRKKFWWLIGILLGSLAGIKIYAAVLLLPTVGLIATYQWLVNKKFALLKSLTLGGLIAGVSLLMNRGNLGFPFIWSPGWFIKTMFQAGDKLNYDVWELQRLALVQGGIGPRLILHWLIGTTIFLIGNFGIKLLGFGALLTGKSTNNNKIVWLLTGVALLSILIPSFYIQKGVVWNSIQFMNYAQVPLLLLTLLFLKEIFKTKAVRKSILTGLLILALPTLAILTYRNFNPDQYLTIPSATINQLKSLDLPKDKAVILEENLASNSLVPAITGKAVFRADPTVLSILGLKNRNEASCPDNAVFLKNNNGELTIVTCQQ
jgi:hypothetical protein